MKQNTCGCFGEKANPPDVDAIYKESALYNVDSSELKNDFDLFEKKANNVVGAMHLIKDANADNIRYLIRNSLTEFGVWVDNIDKMNLQNLQYLDEMKKSDKKFIQKNMGTLGNFDQPQMESFEDLVIEHKNVAALQRDALSNIIPLISREMSLRRNQLVSIESQMKKSMQLKAMHDKTSPIFSHDKEVMKDIDNKMRLCHDITKNKPVQDTDLKEYVEKIKKIPKRMNTM